MPKKYIIQIKTSLSKQISLIKMKKYIVMVDQTAFTRLASSAVQAANKVTKAILKKQPDHPAANIIAYPIIS
jgi:hypothetical protein